jgi:hypothetical protein
MGNELPQLIVADATAWRTWLAGHHDDPIGVLLTLAKKDTTEPTSLTETRRSTNRSASAGSMVRPGAAVLVQPIPRSMAKCAGKDDSNCDP